MVIVSRSKSDRTNPGADCLQVTLSPYMILKTIHMVGSGLRNCNDYILASFPQVPTWERGYPVGRAWTVVSCMPSLVGWIMHKTLPFCSENSGPILIMWENIPHVFILRSGDPGNEATQWVEHELYIVSCPYYFLLGCERYDMHWWPKS